MSRLFNNGEVLFNHLSRTTTLSNPSLAVGFFGCWRRTVFCAHAFHFVCYSSRFFPNLLAGTIFLHLVFIYWLLHCFMLQQHQLFLWILLLILLWLTAYKLFPSFQFLPDFSFQKFSFKICYVVERLFFFPIWFFISCLYAQWFTSVPFDPTVCLDSPAESWVFLQLVTRFEVVDHILFFFIFFYIHHFF